MGENIRFCTKCGAQIKEGKQFCTNCGTPVVQVENVVQVEEQLSNFVQSNTPSNAGEEKLEVVEVKETTKENQAEKKIKKPVNAKVLACAGVLLLFLIVGFFLFKGTGLPNVSYSYLNEKLSPTVEYEMVETIYPSLYNTMDSIVNFTATCEQGQCDVMVKAEIPGFTQAYEQKFTLNQQLTQFYIKPPVLAGDLSLNSSKDAQLNFSITDISTGNVIVQDTKPVKLMSRYDFILWEDEFGYSNWDNFLAWMTPEDPKVQQVKRVAIEWLSQMTGGQFSMLPGYQDSGLFGNQIQMNTYYQALGIQGAMSSMGIRYNAGSFSMSDSTNQLQRVQLPNATIESLSGVCIETSLVVASALQSAGMHVMLIFPPGHAQVAVECWPNTGEYFLIETTILPVTEQNMGSIVSYKSKQEWIQYLQDPWGNGSGSCYVLDCDLATPMGILPLSN